MMRLKSHSHNMLKRRSHTDACVNIYVSGVHGHGHDARTPNQSAAVAPQMAIATWSSRNISALAAMRPPTALLIKRPTVDFSFLAPVNNEQQSDNHAAEVSEVSHAALQAGNAVEQL